MRKGIIFTTDAILALIVVMILLAMVAMQASNNEDKVFQNLEGRARDEAITKFYKEDTIGVVRISEGAIFGKCAVYYGLYPDNPLGTQAVPQGYIFCEEA